MLTNLSCPSLQLRGKSAWLSMMYKITHKLVCMDNRCLKPPNWKTCHQHCNTFQIPAAGINHRKFALELPTVPLVTFKVWVGWRAPHLISSSSPITISPSKVKKKLVKVKVHVAEFGCGTGWLAVNHSLSQWLRVTLRVTLMLHARNFTLGYHQNAEHFVCYNLKWFQFF